MPYSVISLNLVEQFLTAVVKQSYLLCTNGLKEGKTFP